MNTVKSQLYELITMVFGAEKLCVMGIFAVSLTITGSGDVIG
ncbi:hypothetical protein [Nitrosomonas eutropha]|nr:hypothetical protein [Nitrosomonas eutropha]